MARIRPILVLIVAVLVVIVCLAPPANALAPAGGGFFWQSPQPFGSGWYIYNLTFADASHVWGVESGNRLASSDDGGLTWTTVDPGVEGDLYGLTFPDAQHGRLFASWWDTQTKTAQAALVYTDNGGASWATRPMPSRFDTYDAAFATADKGWIVGYGWDKASHKSRPMMLTTTDAGQTWQPSVLRWVRLTRSRRSTRRICGCARESQRLGLVRRGRHVGAARTAWRSARQRALPRECHQRVGDGREACAAAHASSTDQRRWRDLAPGYDS